MTTLYLHGFLSSPQSTKCRMLAAAHERRGVPFLAPDLNVEPEEAARLIESIAEGIPAERLTVVGSSLGGFYAAWLAERKGCRSVLLNPAVRPWDFVKDHLGEQEVAGGSRTITVSGAYAGQLLKLKVPAPKVPERMLVLLSTADEVLDWREADMKYREAARIHIEGGDHQISNFDQYCEAVADYCCRGLGETSF